MSQKHKKLNYISHLFTISFSHKKEVWSKKHTADIVLPGASHFAMQTLGIQNCAFALCCNQRELSWKALELMCHHPSLASYYWGAGCCARHMAIRQSGPPWASMRERAATVCTRSLIVCEWLAQQCHFGSGCLRHRRWIVVLQCGTLAGRRCHEIAFCHSDSVWFWHCSWHYTTQRHIWGWLFLLMNCRLRGGWSAVGWSSWQRRWYTFIVSWWVCLFVVHENQLQLMSFGWWRCIPLAWLR